MPYLPALRLQRWTAAFAALFRYGVEASEPCERHPMIATTTVPLDDLSLEAQGFYRQAIRVLHEARVPFLVGGAYALAQYTGIVRHTKDFDVFVRPTDARRALDAFRLTGYRTELTFAHWLGKVFYGQDYVDVIFSSGNGVAKVDERWFAHATPARFLGEDVLLCPPEEMIWSKAFVVERERYDGADINHLLRSCGQVLDWPRILERFGSCWPVLLSHLLLFGFVYPTERDAVPEWVLQDLIGRLEQELQGPPATRRLCRGTLLSRVQYVVDLDQWGYEDARLEPPSSMTPEQARGWTEAGLREQHP
jgi:hypothetical protein